MSTLDRTERRIFRAVDRLEAAFRATSTTSTADGERMRLAAQLEVLGRESSSLREQRDELQRKLDDLCRRHEAMQAVAAAAEERLAAAIAELDDLLRA